MKYVFLLLSILVSFPLLAEPLRTLVKIEKLEGDFKIIRMAEGDHIPAIPAGPEVREKLKNLPHGTEAVMEGHITYEKISGDNTRQLRPFFVIESLHPVSLADLGNAGKTPEPINPSFLKEEHLLYRQLSFPVTTEVASAITMTTSILMMEELTSGKNDPEGQREIRKALFITTGAMATMLFLYEQFKGISKP